MRNANTKKAFALLAAACLSAACGHIQGDKAEIRVFNALYDYAALDLFVGDRLKIDDLPFGVLSPSTGVSVVGNDEPPDGGGGTTTTASVTSSTTSTTLVTAALVTTSVSTPSRPSRAATDSPACAAPTTSTAGSWSA